MYVVHIVFHWHAYAKSLKALSAATPSYKALSLGASKDASCVEHGSHTCNTHRHADIVPSYQLRLVAYDCALQLANNQPHVHVVVHTALLSAMCVQAMVVKLCRRIRFQTLMEAQAKSTVCLCALLYTSTWDESSPQCLTV